MYIVHVLKLLPSTRVYTAYTHKEQNQVYPSFPLPLNPKSFSWKAERKCTPFKVETGCPLTYNHRFVFLNLCLAKVEVELDVELEFIST